MDIETIINELKKQDPREAHITAPLALLQEYEQAGFSTDGAVFEENGERLVNLQKSFVFDNAEALVAEVGCELAEVILADVVAGE